MRQHVRALPILIWPLLDSIDISNHSYLGLHEVLQYCAVLVSVTTQYLPIIFASIYTQLGIFDNTSGGQPPSKEAPVVCGKQDVGCGQVKSSLAHPNHQLHPPKHPTSIFLLYVAWGILSYQGQQQCVIQSPPPSPAPAPAPAPAVLSRTLKQAPTAIIIISTESASTSARESFCPNLATFTRKVANTKTDACLLTCAFRII